MANLNDLIERGMAFFNGETVSKAELTAAKADSTRLTTELATANQKISDLTQSSATAQASIAAKDSEISTLKAQSATQAAEITILKEKVAALEKDAKSLGGKAAQIVAAAGIAPVSLTTQTDSTSTAGKSETEQATEFSKLVSNRMKEKSESKGVALEWAIQNFPKEYAEWRKGDTSKL